MMTCADSEPVSLEALLLSLSYSCTGFNQQLKINYYTEIIENQKVHKIQRAVNLDKQAHKRMVTLIRV